MRLLLRIAILLHIVSSGVVEPRIRQASSSVNTGSFMPAKLPKIIRRRKSSTELILIPSTGGSNNDDNGMQQPGIMTTVEGSAIRTDLQGLNNAIRKNQMKLVAQAPQLNMFMKDRHEQPNLLSRINERNKKIMVQEVTEPTAMLRIFSLSMSMPVDERDADLMGYDRDFSMSVRMGMTRSTDHDAAITEERDFYLRSGSLSMIASLPEDRDILLFQMSSMSMDSETKSALVRKS